MGKTLRDYFLFIFYLEITFHLLCFKEITILNIFILFSITLSFAVLLTILTTLPKKDKIKLILIKTISTLLSIIFCAELVYYQIYESFFNINGLFFITAIKDGYDKVLLTIIQNILGILLLLAPTIFILIKKKEINMKKTKIEVLSLVLLLVLGISYTTASIFFIDNKKDYSLYNLIFKVNMPIQNVKSFGLISSGTISIERKLFGFIAIRETKEDILTNKKTSLTGSMNVKYNEQAIDFEKLIATETNPTIKEMHEYFNNQTPTDQNNFTGIFKDKNVIFIMAESFDEIAIDKDLTPTLYKLKTEGIKFSNYFAPKYPASTADGEYMLEWGILPVIGEYYSLIDMVYNVNPYILPRSLKQNGYKTYVYHNYAGNYNRRKNYFSTLDFDGMKYCGEGINTECHHFHGSDLDMMEQTTNDFIKNDKFFTYYITLSGHGSYDNSNYVAKKHINKLSNYNYPSNLKYYMAANIDFDLSMEILVNKLKEANKLDDTVIIISSDHSPYYLTNEQVNLRSTIDRTNRFDRDRGSLIIYNSAIKENYNIEKYAMNIDVLPTILNMLNIPYDSRLIIGKDIMAKNTEGLVIFPDRSWITNKGSYDNKTGKFTPFIENIDEKYISKINQDVNDKYQTSINMQYNDYYKYIFK